MPNFLRTIKLLSSSGAERCIPDFSGLLLRNKWKFLMGWSLTLTRVLLGETNSLYVIGVYRFSTYCARTIRHNGVKFLVMRLKAFSMMVMQTAAGHPNPKPLTGRFRRSSSGFPVLLPVEHRRKILAGDPRVTSFWLSLLGFYRVLVYPGKVSLGTIVLPGKDFSVFHDEIRESFYDSLRSLHREVGLPSGLTPTVWKRRMFNDPDTRVQAPEPPLSRKGLGFTLFPIFKSSPSPWTRSVTEEGRKAPTAEMLKRGAMKPRPEVSSGWYALIDQAKSLVNNSVVFNAFCEYAEGTGNDGLARIVKFFTTYAYPPTCTNPIGWLSQIQEAAGKVRVVAMLDPFTQWLLYPLHDQFFKLFKKIDMDGCHDQVRPLHILMENMKKRGVRDIYSFDLSAATDRLPRFLQVEILTILLSRRVAVAWETLLTARKYVHRTCLNPNYKGKKVYVDQDLLYRVGQPMGAYSSWAMLNITHHLIVQWAYQRAYFIKPENQFGTDWFRDYAVLGDDIVIGSKRVADEYLVIMELLGVPINMSKSLVSNNGSAEFAKRFFLKYKDASPISFKELLVARKVLTVALELCTKVLRFRKENISILLDIFGRKYKSKSIISSNISGLSKTLAYLVLGWLSRANEYDLTVLTQKSLYNTRPSVLDTKPLRKVLFGMVMDSIKAAYARIAIYGYEENYFSRAAEISVVPFSKPGRFIFRGLWAFNIYDKYYRVVGQVRKLGKKIQTELEEQMRHALWSYSPVKDMTESQFWNLIQMKLDLDDLREQLPGNLNIREDGPVLKMWPSRVTFAYGLRRKTKRFVNLSKPNRST